MISTQKSRVWFVTSASTGFGRKLAEAALAKGDRVGATARKLLPIWSDSIRTMLAPCAWT